MMRPLTMRLSTMGLLRFVAAFLCCVLAQTVWPKAVWGQTPPAAAPDEDLTLQPLEPDFTLINLPTTLRLPVHKSNFHLTHRFYGNLRDGSFGHQLSNLFGLDNGAAIGFEYRFAVMKHVQAAAYRTNLDRETEFYAKFDPIAQSEHSEKTPLSISALLSVEGANNFRQNRSPALGAVVSRKIADAAEVYATPVWVHSTTVGSVTRETGFIGLGGRVHVRSSMYLLAEVSPRVGGYAPGPAEYSFALGGRVGYHVFQMNFSNTTGTTFAQTARGGAPHSLFLGFNLARKFY
jgi:hypothetical protein